MESGKFVVGAAIAAAICLVPVASATMATGGSVVSTNGTRIHTFLNSGTFSVSQSGTVEVLVVGGGGGGSGSTYGSGGGAGGLIYTNVPVAAGSNLTVTIGAGGSAGAGATGGTGGNSVFGSLTALGGGGGGYAVNGSNGGNGGSGGGAYGTFTVTVGSGLQPGSASGGYGNSGAKPASASGGGGGGAGSAGLSGRGGTGMVFSICGTGVVYYAGGGSGAGTSSAPPGGGGWSIQDTAARAGMANTGGGGGGGWNGAGAAGGSGIVIVRYDDPQFPQMSSSGATGIVFSTAWLGGTLVSTGTSATAWGAIWGTNNPGASMNGWTGGGTTYFGQAYSENISTSVQVSGLIDGTAYYYSMWATNAAGANVSTPVSFTTVSMKPALSNIGASNITDSSAVLYGVVVNTGIAACVTYVCYGTSPVALDSTNVIGASSEGAVSSQLSGLVPNTKYYYRFAGSNSAGLGYAPAVTNFSTLPGTRYVDAAATNSVYPFTNWATAAGTIQDAIDASGAGDTIFVTNGVYSTGGRAVCNGFTNRVCLDLPVVVRSVNGPAVTVITGAGPCGSNAVRCAYVGTNAVLAGFTLTNGATRAVGDVSREQSGGGVWCESSGTVSNCVVSGNVAVNYGGGIYNGVVQSCRISGNYAVSGGGVAGVSSYNSSTMTPTAPVCVYNSVITGNSATYGGGALYAWLVNCAITLNRASQSYGAINISVLNNCTVVGNTAASFAGAGLYITATNSIIYNNPALMTDGDLATGMYTDFSVYPYVQRPYATLTRCCALQATSTNGTGNITNDPQLVSAWHISTRSPCVTNGAAGAIGTDLDGDAWRTPPSRGCDEPLASTATGLLTVAIVAGGPVRPDGSIAAGAGVPVGLIADISGIATTSVWAFGTGICRTNAPVTSYTWTNAGVYTLMLSAYNATYPAGVSSSLTVRIEAPGIRYVNAANATPAAPYTNWDTAATSIQDAIDAAVDGDTVLVTNGVYSSGVSTAFLSRNRIVISKSITVRSVNGPGVTTIAGAGPCGPDAVRCAYLGVTNAVLAGFTLTGGATDTCLARSGGGVSCVYGVSMAVISNCVITGNQADASGGGVSQGRLISCRITDNRAMSTGGGIAGSHAVNCIIERNRAVNGGGADSGTLVNCGVGGNAADGVGGGTYSVIYMTNCTVAGNQAGSEGGGVYGGTHVNCIVSGNDAPLSPDYSSASFTYSCLSPVPAGAGNIPGSPQLTSCYRLAAGSPCTGAGTNVPWVTDLDGRERANPPSIGACEGAGLNPTGALEVAVSGSASTVGVGVTVSFLAHVIGEATSSVWSFGDGSTTNNSGALVHSWSAAGVYVVNFRAFNADNPEGVGTVYTVTVRQPATYYVDASCGTSAAPFTNWTTAATSIQDAVDAALDGDLVLVTNGVYQTGGGRLAALYLDLVGGLPSTPNRVTVEKRVEVRSINGAAVTTIRGAGTTNGPGAMRCVFLGNGARLTGFTLEGGHTVQTGAPDYLYDNGGGARCSPQSVVAHCTIRSNSARFGGGVCGGTLDHCTLQGNTADGGNGSGVRAAKLKNCLLTGHSNDYALYNSTAYNCTIAGNMKAAYGGVLVNCIAYGNTSTNSLSSLSATNCCLAEAIAGAGCFVANPMFVNSGSGNYRLNGASPCVDAGVDMSAVGITNDLDGTTRPLEGNGDGLAACDLGCYEFNAEGASVPPIPLANTVVVSSWAPSDFRAPYLGGLGYTSRVVLVSGAAHGTITTTSNWFHYVPSSSNYQGADSFTWKMTYTGAGAGTSGTTTCMLTLRDGPTNDWMQWRYDEHRSAMAPVILPPVLTLQWRRDIPTVAASYNSYPDLEYCRPVQQGKTLFVPVTASDSLAAYDTDTGTNKWTFYASGAIRRPPLVVSVGGGTNIVVVGSDDGSVYALNAVNGAQYWKFRAAPDTGKLMGFGRLSSVWPVFMSPAASAGKLYFGAGFLPSSCLYLYCVDAGTGSAVWRSDGGTVDGGQNSGLGPLTISTDHTRVYGANGKRNAWQLSAASGAYWGLLNYGACSFYVDGNGIAPFSSFKDNSAYGRYNPSETISITTGDRVITPATAAGLGVAGTVTSLLAGDGKLFVTTAQGGIYCFGGSQQSVTNIFLNAPVSLPVVNDAWTYAAGSILNRADLKQGLALVWGVGSGRLVEELAKQGGANLMVVACDPDPEKLRAIRVKMDAAGWSGARVSTVDGYPLDSGFAPYQAGIIASEDLTVSGYPAAGPGQDSAGIALVSKLYECTRPFGGEIWLPTADHQHSAIRSWLAATNLPACNGLPSYTVSRQAGFTRISRTGFPDAKLPLRPPFRPIAFGEEYGRNSTSLNLELTTSVSRGLKAPGSQASSSAITRDIYTWLPAPAAATGYEPAGQANVPSSTAAMPGTLMNTLYGITEGAPGIALYAENPKCPNFTGAETVTYRNFTMIPGKRTVVYEGSTSYWGAWYIGDRGGCSWYQVPYRTLAGDGVFVMTGGHSGCGCATAVGMNATQFAAVPASGGEQWLYVRASKSFQFIQEQPAKRVGINFGAQGDRLVEEDQMLWTHHPYQGRDSQNETAPLIPVDYRGTAWPSYHYSATITNVQARDRRWVSASQVQGMTGVTVRLANALVAEAAPVPPVVNGVLSDACWANGQGVNLPVRSDRWNFWSPVSCANLAMAMVRYDSTNLYVGGFIRASLSTDNAQRYMRVAFSSRTNTGVRMTLSDSTRDGRESTVVGIGSWQSAYANSSTNFSAEFAIPWSVLASAGLAPTGLLMNVSVCGMMLNGQSSWAAESLTYGMTYGIPEAGMFSPLHYDAVGGAASTQTAHMVRLYFAEMEDKASGQRVFDVSVQGVKVLTNLDVAAQAGVRNELVKTYTGVMISDKLDVDFTAKAGSPMLSGIEIIETATNMAPQIVSAPAAVPGVAGTGVLVNFAVGAEDLNGDALTYIWSFGDGSTSSPQAVGTISHAYASMGTYTARVTVSDGQLAVTGSVVVSIVSDYAYWQRQQFGAGESASVSQDGDFDCDGMSNYAEWRAGTDPVDQHSALSILTESLAGGTNLVLSWPSVAGRKYGIEASTNLEQGFTLNITSNIPATAPVNTETVTVDPAGQRFYRVRLE